MIWVKSQAHKKYSCFNEMKKVHALISFYIVWRKKSRKEYTDKILKDEI